MRRILSLSLMLIASVAVAQERSGIEVQNAQVILINDPTIFAGKPGRLTAGPEEGDIFAADEAIARVDDTEALLNLKAAMVEEDVAKKQAANNVDIRYAEAQEEVTMAEYEEALAANRKAKNAMSESEIRRRKFQHERSKLATEQARNDHIIAQAQVKVATAKVQAAKHEWDTRRIKAPVGGVVSQRYAQVGEWVNAGDPIAKLMQLDEVRVIGYVDSNSIARNDVIGKKVVIEVSLTGNRKERYAAEISHAGLQVGTDNTYKVWADIKNVIERNQYVIHPGSAARMMIDTGDASQRQQFLTAPGPGL